MKIDKTKIIIAIPVIIVLIGVITLLSNLFSSKEIVMTGIVEGKSIDVASKIPGRVDKMNIKEGDVVKKGDILAILESKEMDAKVAQARSLMEAARQKLMLVKKGARDEEKDAALKLFDQARYQYEYANKTWSRFQKLYKDSVVSAQEKDGVEFQYKAAQEQMGAAKDKYDMAMKGARPEEISATEALFNQAANGYNEAIAYFQELTIKAPVDGEISNRIVEEGEVISAGYPVFTILVPDESYVVLQVREDNMQKIKKGMMYKGKIPALGNAEYEFECTYIAPMGDFATWKPTNQKGEFDLKVFEIHLRSKQPIKDFRPGMTVNISL